MSFSDRFELLDLVRGDEVQTFRARERATGRVVEAHFAPSQEILSHLDAGTVIDRGAHEGKFYVVTSQAAAGSASLDSAGAWRVKQPAQPPVQPAPSQETAEPAPAAAPGDFTRMFQLRQAPEPVAIPVSKPAHPSQVAALPGEFTRAFQKPSTAVSVAPSAAPEPGQPGEFTRMFQTPAVPQAGPAIANVPDKIPQDRAVPAPAPAASQLIEENGLAAPRRISSSVIVIAVVLLFVIAVFVLLRKLY